MGPEHISLAATGPAWSFEQMCKEPRQHSPIKVWPKYQTGAHGRHTALPLTGCKSTSGN